MMVDPFARISLVAGDITALAVDAIVNAANESLAGGGGVDGAIHRAAGCDELQAECRKIGGCATGDAKITPGFRLKARFIIHTVGPVYQGGQRGEAELLASAYRRSMQVAEQHQVTSLAFPAISTGIYGYPLEEATEIALKTVASELRTRTCIERVLFIFFSQSALEIANEVHARLMTR